MFSTTPMGKPAGLLLWLCMALFALPALQAQTVTPWLTQGDQSQLIANQATVNFAGSSSNGFATLNLDPSQTFQSLEGLGFMLTQGSAEVIRNMPTSQKNALLDELFHPSTGLGISMLRISIGASDLSNSTYTYSSVSGDVNMDFFSLNGPDQTYLIPLLQEILAINPAIKILATPWTAPIWMKTNGAYVGGRLSTTYYGAYATYFVKYLEAMAAQNISIWGLTPQNEPENGNNTPSMLMDATEQTDFINNHLGPALAASSFSPKLIVFDHNCDNPNYPISVLNNSGYADGAAFHLYGGDISAMSQVRNATGKDVYFTEQYTDIAGSFDGDLSWHMRNVVIGSLNNWSRTVLEWNLATDPTYGPRTQGGCTECLGALTIASNGSFTRNVSYYIIGQLARFARAGAIRFASSSNQASIYSVAFKNPDDSKTLLVYNDRNQASSVKVVEGSQSFTWSIPANSAVSFVWSGGGSQGGGGTNNFSGFYNIIARHSGKGLDVAGASTSNGANVEQYEINNGGGDNQQWEFEEAGGGAYYIKARHSNMCLSLASNQNTDGVNVVQKTCTGASNQKWTVTDLGGGYYSMQNLQNGRVLDVASSSTANGANVQTWSNFSSNNQQWQLVSQGSGGNGNSGGQTIDYYNILARHSGKGLDVAGSSNANGANVEQYAISNGGGDNQRWRFEDAGNGQVYIKAKHSDKCLAAANNQNSDGVNVVQANFTGATKQKWTLTDLGNGYHRVENALHGRVLDVSSAATANGANVQLWSNFSSNNQQWELVLVESVSARRQGPAAEDAFSSMDVKLFPNPTSNKITLSIPGGSTLESWKLVDALGKVYGLPPGKQSATQLSFSLDQLPSGLYFLQGVIDGRRLVKAIQKY